MSDLYAELAAYHHGVDPDLFAALVNAESGGVSNPARALSSAGAMGPGQLMPATAKAMGVRDIHDPLDNLMGSAKYLSQQLRDFGGDPRLALAAYNAGPGAVRKFGGVPPYKETQGYVAKILGMLNPIKSAQAEEMPQGDDLYAAYGITPTKADKGKDIASRTSYDPTEGMSGPELRMAGAGKAIVDTGRGIGQMLRHVVPETIADNIGLPTRADIDESKRIDQPLMRTGNGLAGNIAGNVVMSLAPGGALRYAGIAAKSPALVAASEALLKPQTFRQGATLGALLGAMQPVGTDQSALAQTGAGAAIGGLGAVIPNAISRVIQPKTREAVKKLIDEGVTPTPGQILGGAAQRVEEGATSVPFIGDAIKKAQRNAVEDMNKAAFNRALAPIGQNADDIKPGNEGVKEVYQRISNAYDDILPTLRVRRDSEFDRSISSLRSLAKGMPSEQAGQFDRMLKNDVLSRFTPEGNMLGDTMKQVDAKLGQTIRRYGSSPNPDHQQLADAFKEVQATLRDLVYRNNPGIRDKLTAVNKAFANYMRIEDAAKFLGANDGVFSAANLLNSVKTGAGGVRKRQFAHGDALMQDLARAAKDVLGNKVPDSGTAFRLHNMLPLGGAYMLSPDLAIGALGAAGLYSKPGMSLAKLLLTQRPQGAAAVSQAISRLAPYLSRSGAAAGLDLSQQ